MTDEMAQRENKPVKSEGITLTVQEIDEQLETEEYREKKVAEVLQTFEGNAYLSFLRSHFKRF